MANDSRSNSTVPKYSKISPTAKVVAYWRKFSDVPFANDVAEMVNAKEVWNEILQQPNMPPEDLSWVVPWVEARYKSMVQAIKNRKIKQVLEFASGLSLRGLAMTSNPEITYVETDLPGMSTEKKAIVQQIQKQQHIPQRKNLFFKEANVLDRTEVERAVEPFSKDKQVAVIHEGLFQYLSLPEKELAATHISLLLQRFGGVWMTPDLNTKEDIDQRWNPNDFMRKMNQWFIDITQRDFREAAFENDAHIHEFADKLGFKVEVVPQLDQSYDLSSMKILNISPETVKQYADSLKIWILTLK